MEYMIIGIKLPVILNGWLGTLIWPISPVIVIKFKIYEIQNLQNSEKCTKFKIHEEENAQVPRSQL